MSKLPALTGREAIRAFEKIGFSVDRIRGSHHILKKPGFRYALSIPVHGSKSVSRRLLQKLISLADLTEEEFSALL